MGFWRTRSPRSAVLVPSQSQSQTSQALALDAGLAVDVAVPGLVLTP